MNAVKSILVMMVALSASASTAWAGTSTLIKTDRQDFSALIAEGVEGQKVLREELRKEAGLGDRERHWTADLKETGRVLMGTLDSEQVVSPTTNFVRQKPKAAGAESLNEQRMAEEFNRLDH